MILTRDHEDEPDIEECYETTSTMNIFMGIGGGLILMGILIWFWYRRTKRRPVDPRCGTSPDPSFVCLNQGLDWWSPPGVEGWWGPPELESKLKQFKTKKSVEEFLNQENERYGLGESPFRKSLYASKGPRNYSGRTMFSVWKDEHLPYDE